MNFRLLTADEIELRIGTLKENSGYSLLLYKDARCDMRILDETFGITGWQRTHELIDGQLFCNVKVKDISGDWVTKQDVGTESYSEKEKGRASDSFKRACFNLGIGRELYTAPFIWISDNKASKQNTAYKNFRVGHIAYDKNKITELVIEEFSKDKKKWEIIYTFGVKKPNKKLEVSDVVSTDNNVKKQEKEETEKVESAEEKAEREHKYYREMIIQTAKKYGLDIEEITKLANRYELSTKQITRDTYSLVITELEAMKPKGDN